MAGEKKTTETKKKTVKCTPAVMKTCEYSSRYNSGTPLYCDYLCKTGQRRVCKPECCDKYVKRSGKKQCIPKMCY